MDNKNFIDKLIRLENRDMFTTIVSNSEFIEKLIKINAYPNDILDVFNSSKDKDSIIVGVSRLLPLSKNLFFYLISRFDDVEKYRENFIESNRAYLTQLKEYLSIFEQDFDAIKKEIRAHKPKIKDIDEDKLQLTKELQEKRLELENEKNSLSKQQSELQTIESEIELLNKNKESLKVELKDKRKIRDKLKADFDKSDKNITVEKEEVEKDIVYYTERLKTLKDDIKFNNAKTEIEETVKPLIKKVQAVLKKHQDDISLLKN